MISLEDKTTFQTMTQEQLDQEFTIACKEGKLDTVKYLLISPNLKEHADIHYQKDKGLLYACFYGHLEVVQYLLTSPELKEHADIHAQNEHAFLHACEYGNLEIVKYLLTSSDLKEHADIHAREDKGFIWASRNGHLKIIDYLIIEQNMNVSDLLLKKIKEEPSEGYIYALKLIGIRDLNQKLDSILDIKDTKKIKRGKV